MQWKLWFKVLLFIAVSVAVSHLYLRITDPDLRQFKRHELDVVGTVDEQMDAWADVYLVKHYNQRIRSEPPRGVVALEPIPKLAKILSVPVDKVVHKGVMKDSPIGKTLTMGLKGAYQMGVFVMWDCFYNPDPIGHALCISWPKSVDDSVYRWLPDEVEALRPSTYVHDRIIQKRKTADKAWETVSLFCSEHTDLFPQMPTRSQWEWAWINVKMRNFHVSDRSGDDHLRTALVPYGDLYNHRRLKQRPKKFYYWELSESGDSVDYFSDSAFDVGEEIFISYGRTTLMKMLLNYGYTLPPPGINVDPYDFYLWDLTPKVEDPLYLLKQDIVDDWPDAEHPYVYETYVPNKPTMAMARLFCTHDEELLQSDAFVEKVKRGTVLDEENSKCAFNFIESLLREHVKRYPHPDEDRALLALGERTGNMTWNMRTAIRFRLIESTILHNLIALYDKGKRRKELEAQKEARDNSNTNTQT